MHTKLLRPMINAKEFLALKIITIQMMFMMTQTNMVNTERILKF